MSQHKTRALVLQVLPYRESSCIVYLLTEALGLTHVLAKGIRAPSKSFVPLERGQEIEAFVYVKPHRELQTLGAFSLVDTHDRIRSNLLKTAMRDAAFEAALRSIHPEEQNPDLYAFCRTFLTEMAALAGAEAFPFELWRFYYDFSARLGFGPDVEVCSVCKGNIDRSKGGYLSVAEGRVCCTRPACSLDAASFLPGPALQFLQAHGDAAPGLARNLSRQEKIRITRLLASYCRYHFETRSEYKSLEFVCELI